MRAATLYAVCSMLYMLPAVLVFECLTLSFGGSSSHFTFDGASAVRFVLRSMTFSASVLLSDSPPLFSMSIDGEYEEDIDSLIEADQQAAAASSHADTSTSPHDTLPSLEHVDESGGGFILDDEQTSEANQQKEQLSGNKRKHSEPGLADNGSGTAVESDELDDFTADDIDRLIAQHEQSTRTPPPPPQPQPPPQSSLQPHPNPASNPSALLACSECHALAYNVPYYKAFGVLVCNGCQSQHPATYQLLTKSTAKAQYLTADADLNALPHLLRPNPTKGSFANMKLYRKLDVLSLVNRQYGSESAMEAEKQRRQVDKLEKEVAKRRKGRAAIEKEKRVREWRVEKEVEGKGHKHTFVDVVAAGGKKGVGGGGGGKKQKCSSCGFTLEFEEL